MKKTMTIIGSIVSVVLVAGLAVLIFSGNLGNAISAFNSGYDRGAGYYSPARIVSNLYARPGCFPNQCDAREMGRLMCIEESVSTNSKFKDYRAQQAKTAYVYQDNPTGLQCAVSLFGPDSDPTYLVAVGATVKQLRQNYDTAFDRLSR